MFYSYQRSFPRNLLGVLFNENGYSSYKTKVKKKVHSSELILAHI